MPRREVPAGDAGADSRTQRPARIGLFGGSFDPIHVGHIAAAEDAAEALGLDRVLIVPVGIPPHKERGAFASGEDRLAMAREAAKGCARLEVSDIEVRRSGRSYTVDTVRALMAELGLRVEIWLLLGTDAVRDIASWRESGELLRLARPAVLRRPGEEPPDWRELARALPVETVERLERSLVRLPHGRQVSSTEVRRRLAAGEPVSELLPPGVERYIRERGLYGAAPRGAKGADR